MALVDSWESFIRIHGGEPGARYVFEQAMFELLSTENPNKEVHKVNASHGDGGIDVYVYQDHSRIDVYQCKFFMGAMNSSRWSQIKNSFDRAEGFIQSDNSKSLKIRNWYLCMPREMQKEDIGKWNSFIKHNSTFVNDIKLIDGNEIIQRMRKCDRLYNTDMISRYFTIPSEGKIVTKTNRNIQKKYEYAIYRALRDSLESINQEKGCNNKYYVPLEVQSTRTIKGKQKRKTEDLLSSLKDAYNSYFLNTVWNQKIHTKKMVYLILGEPGSGKSIALRKFCLDLLSKPDPKKKIPVYIDLGKWVGKWSAIEPPSKKDLLNYVKRTLNETIQDSELNIYFNKSFNSMLEEGRWLFVFDSFDEIPCLMGSGNNQELIGKISKLIHDFLTDGKRGGGIVASRFYKEPSEYLEATVTLEIKEFNDLRIKTMLNKYLGNASDVVDELFKYHERLVILCRNPFYLSLLIGYIKNNGKFFPKNQMELYNHYLNSCLEKHDGKMSKYKLIKSDVITAAKKLSVFMQQSTEYGLECPKNAFNAQNGEEKKWDDCLQILETIRLCHYNVHEGTVSFVHRRFQEFFIAENFKETETSQRQFNIDYNTIISHNSGLRDALALYCEVADLNKATEIACFCWQSLKDHISFRTTMDEKGSLILVNTLYFMVDAFRNRRDAIKEFYNDYEDFIIKYLDNDTHFIVQAAMVKGVVLFDPKREVLSQMVLRTFELGNERLNDIMMENCRLIKKVDHRIETQFTKYIYRKSIREFLKQFRNTDFALSKAPSFKYVRWMHFLQLINIFLMVIFLAYYYVTPYVLDKLGFPTRALLDEMDSWNRLLTTVNTSNLPRESLSTILFKSHALELFQLAIIVLGISKEKRRPVKFGEPDNHNVLETLFYGMLLMTPVYSYLFTKTILTNSIGLADAHKIFLTGLVGIQISIIAINLPYAIHDIYWYYKSNTLSRGEICIQLMRPSTSFLILSLVAICFVNIIPNLFLSALGALFSIAIVVTMCICIVAMLLLVIKMHFLNHLFIPKKIEIADLVQNLDKLLFNDLKIVYLNRLLDNHTHLEGNWPESLIGEDGHRKKYDNNEIEVALSQLEYNSILDNMRQSDSTN